jgi:phenylalanyl-tRNA synthetase alpha chain
MYKINVSGVINELKEDLGKAINETQVIEIKNHYLKVKLNPLYGELKNMPANEKGPFGKDINDFKLRINEVCDEKFNSVKLENEKKNHKVDYDITVETSNFNKGSLSPITLVFNQILEYFEMLNFTIQSGEEVMSSKYNFDNLNIPATHPTREPSETFYVSDKVSLRTQNTASSAQYIENNFDDEIRIANFGYVYRNDDDDSTHSHQFNQIDFI